METVVLHAKPQGLFSLVTLLKQNGEEVAAINLKVLREAGTLSVADRSYSMEREGRLSGDFILKDGAGTVIVRANKPSIWKNRYVVTFGNLKFELAKTSAWKQGFSLLWNGDSLGTIHRPRWYSREAEIALPDSLPLEVRAFVFWLVMVQWNREAGAA